MAKVCVEFDANGNGGTPSAPVRTYSATVGDGVSLEYDVVHNLDTRDPWVTLRNLVTGDLNDYDVATVAADLDRLTLTFATAPAANSVRVSVLAPPAAVPA